MLHLSSLGYSYAWLHEQLLQVRSLRYDPKAASSPRQVQNAFKPFRLSSKYVRWPLRNELRTLDQEMRTHKKLINNVSLLYD